MSSALPPLYVTCLLQYALQSDFVQFGPQHLAILMCINSLCSQQRSFKPDNPSALVSCMQVQASLDMSSVDNVTAMVICFSKDPPPSRQMGRSASRGPSRSLSRECLSTLSSAILDAQCQPAGLERQNQW